MTTTSAQRMMRMRKRRVLNSPAEIERRRREYLERQRPHPWASGAVPTVVLADWHIDTDGCLARSIGCD